MLVMPVGVPLPTTYGQESFVSGQSPRPLVDHWLTVVVASVSHALVFSADRPAAVRVEFVVMTPGGGAAARTGKSLGNWQNRCTARRPLHRAAQGGGGPGGALKMRAAHCANVSGAGQAGFVANVGLGDGIQRTAAAALLKA